MIKKDRYANKSMGKPINQFRNPKRLIQQLSVVDLDSINPLTIGQLYRIYGSL